MQRDPLKATGHLSYLTTQTHLLDPTPFINLLSDDRKQIFGPSLWTLLQDGYSIFIDNILLAYIIVSAT